MRNTPVWSVNPCLIVLNIYDILNHRQTSSFDAIAKWRVEELI